MKVASGYVYHFSSMRSHCGFVLRVLRGCLSLNVVGDTCSLLTQWEGGLPQLRDCILLLDMVGYVFSVLLPLPLSCQVYPIGYRFMEIEESTLCVEGRESAQIFALAILMRFLSDFDVIFAL